MMINTDMIYPVGSIYMNVENDVNPGTLFGGTWHRIEFRYLVGAGTIEKNIYNGYGSVDEQAGVYGIGAGTTFGEIMHKLTINEMPSHNHLPTNQWFVSYGTGSSWADFGGGGMATLGLMPNTNNAGGGGYHNNLPPSLSVYM